MTQQVEPEKRVAYPFGRLFSPALRPRVSISGLMAGLASKACGELAQATRAIILPSRRSAEAITLGVRQGLEGPRYKTRLPLVSNQTSRERMCLIFIGRHAPG